MILGLDQHPAAACFEELDTAVRHLTDRTVCFNAHVFSPPPGAVVFNLENIPGQVPDPEVRWAGHECWDFNRENAAKYGAEYVPVGYHPSMERFERAPVQDIDVVFSGCINKRRAEVLQQLANLDLNVMVIGSGTLYGAERDAILARAKLALNMLYYEDGTYPVLRAAHLVANKVPMVSELHRDAPSWAGAGVPYASLVPCVQKLLGRMEKTTQRRYEAFKRHPLELPS